MEWSRAARGWRGTRDALGRATAGAAAGRRTRATTRQPEWGSSNSRLEKASKNTPHLRRPLCRLQTRTALYFTL